MGKVGTEHSVPTRLHNPPPPRSQARTSVQICVHVLTATFSTTAKRRKTASTCSSKRAEERDVAVKGNELRSVPPRRRTSETPLTERLQSQRLHASWLHSYQGLEGGHLHTQKVHHACLGLQRGRTETAADSFRGEEDGLKRTAGSTLRNAATHST